MDPTDPLGLASLLGTIRNLYPQARVTSGYRGPNNPLTLRNPASLHAQGSPGDPRAVDIAPIPGMSFGDYVSSVKKAGVPVTQAFDEATHPFPWTTGPNWHLATGAPQQMASYPPRKQKALADLMQPQSVGLMNPEAPPPPPQTPSWQPPTTLADLTMPTVAPKSHKTEHTLGNIAGILGDALMAYSGMQPQFGPALRKQQEDDQQMAFDREKMNAELQLQREKALEPPQFIQDAIAWNGLSRPQQQMVIDQRDAMYPATAFDPTRGTVRVPRSLGGPPPEAISELRAAVGKGDHAAIGEFEQMFGPGSASQYLGGN